MVALSDELSRKSSFWTEQPAAVAPNPPACMSSISGRTVGPSMIARRDAIVVVLLTGIARPHNCRKGSDARRRRRIAASEIGRSRTVAA